MYATQNAPTLSAGEEKAPASKRQSARTVSWPGAALLALLAFGLSFALRMLEWPSWQNPEYRLGQEWLLATHDAYHWVAGAEGFGLGAGHPMSEMLRRIGDLLELPPAFPAFWLPPIFAGLSSVIVFAWVGALGSLEAGFCVALLCSLAPGFLARTQLGYYDTDLITLCFPLLITLFPVYWTTRFSRIARLIRGLGRFPVPAFYPAPATENENPLSPRAVCALALSGLFAHWTLEWHSVFPYLIRYNTALLAFFAFTFGPPGKRLLLLLGAYIYGLPALIGPWGLLLAPLIFAGDRMLPKRTAHANGNAALPLPGAAFFSRPIILCALTLPALFFFLDADVLKMLLGHIAGYVKQAGDTKIDAVGTQLIFPSVAQSIIEVQDLTLAEALFYFHPWAPVSALGLLGFIPVILRRPGALFLLPLGALGLLSMKMGGRMVMFGAPVVALGLTLPVIQITQWLLRAEMRGFASGFSASLILMGVFAAPVVELIPAMSGGPILDRRYAEGLARARVITPEDSFLWLWWDWGYAAHHFARRAVIADGAVHGGASLYLPAAVFAADDPRFARQLIKYTALKQNEASEVFTNLDGEGANALMRRLRAPDTPPVDAPGRQYIIVNFEMLRLGFWISYFGSWDFVKQEGIGSAIGIIPQQLTYKLEDGEVLVQGSAGGISASTINVFEDGKFSRRDYIREWAERNPNAGGEAQRKYYEKRRNIHFLLNRVTDEKLVVDERLYNSMMVRLLIRPAGDPELSPYFRLVYDNIFCRIYEVL